MASSRNDGAAQPSESPFLSLRGLKGSLFVVAGTIVNILNIFDGHRIISIRTASLSWRCSRFMTPTLICSNDFMGSLARDRTSVASMEKIFSKGGYSFSTSGRSTISSQYVFAGENGDGLRNSCRWAQHMEVFCPDLFPRLSEVRVGSWIWLKSFFRMGRGMHVQSMPRL